MPTDHLCFRYVDGPPVRITTLHPAPPAPGALDDMAIPAVEWIHRAVRAGPASEPAS